MPVDNICSKVSEGSAEPRAREAYHRKQIYEHVGMLAENVVRLAAEILERFKIGRVSAAHHIRKVWREHERRSFAFDPELLFVIAEKVTKVDVYVQISESSKLEGKAYEIVCLSGST